MIQFMRSEVHIIVLLFYCLIMKGSIRLDTIKTNLKAVLDYVLAFLKWFVIALVLGIAGGLLGSSFHFCIDFVTELRQDNKYLLLLLPVAPVVITFLYSTFSTARKITTDRVIESVRKNKNIPFVMLPLIYVGTVITHLAGGSAGREGAALQLGGSLGYKLGKILKLDDNDMHIIVMAGMSSVFSALFGTPVTAAIFSLEVTTVGVIHYAGFVPCIISSVAAVQVAERLGLNAVKYEGVMFADISMTVLLRVVLFAVLCAAVSILFCAAHKKCAEWFEKLIKNTYLRAFVVGSLLLLLTVAVGTSDYNGAGMHIVDSAIAGNARPEAFILKLIFTVITIAAGFKGGEIVPAFFIGSTFGCLMAPLLGLEAPFLAAMGFVALFCCVVNCPIASLILSVEVFGTQGFLYFAIVCGVSFMMSGRFGIYHSQKIMYSKIDDEYINRHAI